MLSGDRRRGNALERRSRESEIEKESERDKEIKRNRNMEVALG